MNFTFDATNAASWLAAPPTPGASLPPELADNDTDGLPDGWEAANDLNDPNADADQDGLTNHEEFLAGTDPRDEDNRLRIETYGLELTPAGPALVLGFSARSNKTYSIAYRDTSEGGSWTNLVRFSAVSTNRLVAVTNFLNPTLPPRFFRLATPRLP